MINMPTLRVTTSVVLETGMIDKKLWTPEELQIFSLYNYKCLWCMILDAVTLHELIPKSLAPKTWDRPENRVPLCAGCHVKAHDKGTKFSRTILRQRREEFLGGVI